MVLIKHLVSIYIKELYHILLKINCIVIDFYVYDTIFLIEKDVHYTKFHVAIQGFGCFLTSIHCHM